MIQENISGEHPEPNTTGQTAPSPQYQPAHPVVTASANVNRPFSWMFAFFAAIAILALILGILVGFIAGVKTGQHGDRNERSDRGGMICLESYPVRCYYPGHSGQVYPDYPVYPYDGGYPPYYGTDDGSVSSPPMPGVEGPVGVPEPAPLPEDSDGRDVAPTDPTEAPTRTPSAP